MCHHSRLSLSEISPVTPGRICKVEKQFISVIQILKLLLLLA